MYCGKCGQPVKDENKFCGKCGAKIIRNNDISILNNDKSTQNNEKEENTVTNQSDEFNQLAVDENKSPKRKRRTKRPITEADALQGYDNQTLTVAPEIKESVSKPEFEEPESVNGIGDSAVIDGNSKATGKESKSAETSDVSDFIVDDEHKHELYIETPCSEYIPPILRGQEDFNPHQNGEIDGNDCEIVKQGTVVDNETIDDNENNKNEANNVNDANQEYKENNANNANQEYNKNNVTQDNNEDEDIDNNEILEQSSNTEKEADEDIEGESLKTVEKDNDSNRNKDNIYYSVFTALGILVTFMVIIVGSIMWVNNNGEQTVDLTYGVYTGEVTNKVPNGKGVIKFKDQSELRATFKDGLAEGLSRVVLPDGTYAEGTMLRGKRTGNWTIIKNNSYYIYQQEYVGDVPYGNEKKIVPITIKSISIYNQNGNGESKDLADKTISSSEARFIGSRLKISSSFPTTWQGKLEIKYINPDGTIDRNINTSPAGYTKAKDVLIIGSEAEINVGGWGNDYSNAYKPGTYRIEYYWDGNFLGFTTFDITYQQNNGEL